MKFKTFFYSTSLDESKSLEVGGYPQDLSTMNDKQKKSYVEFLAKKYNLKDLRKRQDLINKQIQIAHNGKNDKAMSNLNVMQKMHDAAVDKISFKD